MKTEQKKERKFKENQSGAVKSCWVLEAIFAQTV